MERESCFSRFKAELLQGRIFEMMKMPKQKYLNTLKCTYNTQRLHSSLDYQVHTHEFEKAFEKSHTFEMHKQATMLLYRRISFN
jgi:hypothetical protein